MITGQLPVANILLKTVRITVRFQNQQGSILEVFRNSMITAAKDLKPGINDFE